jgi:hypothetical protein
MIRLLVTYGLAFATVGGLTAVANSEDRGAWFKSLRQPGTGMSCCDIADCHKTVADWRGGQWWAIVQGAWTPIPPGKELKSSRSTVRPTFVAAWRARSSASCRR